jgi:hypothetical protein
MPFNLGVHSAVAPAPCTFHQGDAVYLAKGPNVGTLGSFLNLRKDPKWADIREVNNEVRSHPVEWLALSTPTNVRK